MIPSRSLRVLVSAVLVAPAAAQVDVPLELWTNGTWPNGLGHSKTNACSFGDLDADGWVDFFGPRSGEYWRNIDGVDWELIPNIIPELYRYGNSIADYNNDGLPDIATEPRGVTNEKMKLLRNLDGISFLEVGSDTAIVDVAPFGDSETNCWADVDFDGNVDLVVPVYPQWHMNGPGNFFLHNQGPTGPGGEHRFVEKSRLSGIDNPPGTSRPEGAEFCDVDGDGDIDFFANATMYQNVSTLGQPLFLDVSDTSGIKLRDVLDEGVALFDHDLDGDFDLIVYYCQPTRPRIYENNGDGTFRLLNKDFVDTPGGSCFGVSKADWDNDGDTDFITASTFRKNMLVETGKRGFTVASTSIPTDHLTNTTYSWADWDRDGDLDMLISAWALDGYLYENTTFDETTPLDEQRYVRLRVVNDSDTVPRGLETEFGASAEIFVLEQPDDWRRRQFVTSSAGYLNQNEYTLHFALPADPNPEDPTQDLHLDFGIDFPTDPSLGLTRIDRHVNPALGNVHLADLVDREITVFRSGAVVLNGCRYDPAPGADTITTATGGGLALASEVAALPDPTDAPADDWYVGLAFDTTLATEPQRIKEVVVDGRIDKTRVNCSGGDAKLLLWDTTDLANPFLVPGGEVDLQRFVRNNRTAYRVDLTLDPGRHYRLVARVDRLRASAVSAPIIDGVVTTSGGLSYTDATPCDGAAVSAAAVDAGQVYLAVRFTEKGGPQWIDLGFAHAGSQGEATLIGSGELNPGNTVTLDLSGALPNQTTILISSLRVTCRPMADGILVPATDVITQITTDANGNWSSNVTLPNDYPPGTTTFFQVWWSDPGASALRAASNALSATSPF